MKRDLRLPVVLSQIERAVLQRLADADRLSASAVIRRLIWREARERGLLLDRSSPTGGRGPAGPTSGTAGSDGGN